MKQKILVIDDDPEVREIIGFLLERDGYDVETVEDADEGAKKINKSSPDLIILDLKLPGISGKELCAILKGKTETKHIPIIMVSGEYIHPADKVTGFDLGADDYLTKPFDPAELQARVRAILRRTTGEIAEAELITDGEIEINLPAHTVKIKDKIVELSPIEFDLLHLLIKKKGEVVKREFLLENLWKGKKTSERGPDNYILRLRKKLGKIGRRIKTVERVGYRYLPKT